MSDHVDEVKVGPVTIRRNRGALVCHVDRVRVDDDEWRRLVAIALLAMDPFAFDHLVEVREDDFAIQHPITERSNHDGQMFDCALHRWLGEQDGPPVAPGRYRAVEQDDPVSPFEFQAVGS